MNGKKARHLRRLAACDVFEWYKSLLPEEQLVNFTKEMALTYTPVVKYSQVDTRSEKKPGSKTIVVAENTVRWFIKQRKKQYGYLR